MFVTALASEFLFSLQFVDASDCSFGFMFVSTCHSLFGLQLVDDPHLIRFESQSNKSRARFLFAFQPLPGKPLGWVDGWAGISEVRGMEIGRREIMLYMPVADSIKLTAVGAFLHRCTLFFRPRDGSHAQPLRPQGVPGFARGGPRPLSCSGLAQPAMQNAGGPGVRPLHQACQGWGCDVPCPTQGKDFQNDKNIARVAKQFDFDKIPTYFDT